MAFAVRSTTYPPGYLDQNRSHPILATAIAFIVLTTVGLGFRTFSRRLQDARWMWADVFMPLSLLFNLGLCTATLLLVRYGAGRHEASLSHEDVVSFKKTLYIAIPCVYLVSVVFSKLAVLDLYLHVFVVKRDRIICYVVGIILILNCVINIPIDIWHCHPFSQLWDPQPGGHCLNVHMHAVWSSFANIITDFVMIILPIPMIVNLHASLGLKIGVFLAFMVGNVGMATSIARFVEMYINSLGQKGTDLTWGTYSVPIWTIVEPGVYHLAACFITYRPLFRWLTFHSPVAPLLVRFRTFTTPSRDTREFSERSRISDVSGHLERHHSLSSDVTHTPGDVDAKEEVDLDTSTPSPSPSRSPTHDDLEHNRRSKSPNLAHTLNSIRRSHNNHVRSSQGQNPLGSGYITVHRSFQVQSGVTLDEMMELPGSRSSYWDDMMPSNAGSPRVVSGGTSIAPWDHVEHEV